MCSPSHARIQTHKHTEVLTENNFKKPDTHAGRMAACAWFKNKVSIAIVIYNIVATKSQPCDKFVFDTVCVHIHIHVYMCV